MKSFLISCGIICQFHLTTADKPSVLSKFSPPANLQEFTPKIQTLWSEKYIGFWMQGEIDANPSVAQAGRTKLSQYFNGIKTPFDQSQNQATITWNAFPNLVSQKFGKTIPLRWSIADSSRSFQDEYLEWSVKRDEKNDIQSVSYTCEGPEYWAVLANYQKKDAVKIMKSMNAPYDDGMSDDDFFLTNPKTQCEVYNPTNQWNDATNTGTIINLIHPSNTLGAEVDIAAQATVIRKNKNGTVITDANELIRCSKYGNPGRNSDPTIGSQINDLAQGGNAIMVADPVALYIHDFKTSNFKLDINGSDDKSRGDLVPLPDSVFNWQRGDINARKGLRLQVIIPDSLKAQYGQGLTVSNIWDTEFRRHIKYGSQFADYITMSVSAVVIPSKVADPLPCPYENQEDISNNSSLPDAGYTYGRLASANDTSFFDRFGGDVSCAHPSSIATS